MKLLNDIDELYNVDIRHHQTLRGGYICPVCDKSYANETTFIKHLEQKSCYNLKSVIADTEIENLAYEWYLEVIEGDAKRATYNVSTFRKDRRYKSFAQTVIFCLKNQERRLIQFLAYMMLVRNYKQLGSALSNMRKESNLREFRMYLQKTDDIDDEQFVSQYYEDLISDHLFLVRSLERAHLSIHTFMEWDVEEIMTEMAIDYKERIQTIGRLL